MPLRTFIADGGTIREYLALTLREEMKEKRVRQRDLALAVGISEKHLSQILNGHEQGSLDLWDRLFREL